MAITPKNPGVVSPPNSLTSQAEGSIGNPNVLTSQAEGSIGNPNSLTSQAEGSVGNPNALTSQAVGDIGNPNSLTAQAVGDVGNPNALTAQAIGSVGNPNVLATQPVAAFPRTLCPVVSLDFENEVYSLAGSPKVLSDLVTYSRASSATFTNRYRDQQGRWKYFLDTDHVGAVTNLLTYSEDFSNAAWTKIRTTVISNATKSANGEIKASKIIASTDNNTHLIAGASSSITASTFAVFSIKAKAAEYTQIRLQNNTVGNGVTFDLVSGAMSGESGGAFGYIKYLSDGWWSVSLIGLSSGGGGAQTFGAYIATGGATTFAGDGVKGIYIDESQAVQNAKPLPYVKTISTSASQAFTASPRLEYDSVTGDRGYLVEGSSTNLLLRSEEFDSETWTKGGVTATANDAIAPDLTKSMDKLLGAGSSSATYQTLTLATLTSYTLSFYTKNIDSVRVRLELYDVTGASTQSTLEYDWIGGKPVTLLESGVTNTRYDDLGGGLFRIVTTMLSSPTNTLHSVYIYPSRASTNKSSHYWGIQLEAQVFATSYTRTEGSTVSRSADTSSLSSSVIPVSNATIHSEQKRSDGTSGQHVYNHTGSTGAIYHVAQAGGVLPLYRYGTVSEVYSVNPPDGEFYTTTMVRSGSSVTAYSGYSSSVETTVDAGAFVANPSNNFEIGRSGGGSYLFGHIKELKIYDVALTAQEVSLL